jgi:hypothetical protein
MSLADHHPENIIIEQRDFCSDEAESESKRQNMLELGLYDPEAANFNLISWSTKRQQGRRFTLRRSEPFKLHVTLNDTEDYEENALVRRIVNEAGKVYWPPLNSL